MGVSQKSVVPRLTRKSPKNIIDFQRIAGLCFAAPAMTGFFTQPDRKYILENN
jgi:hypothetical protein